MILVDGPTPFTVTRTDSQAHPWPGGSVLTRAQHLRFQSAPRRRRCASHPRHYVRPRQRSASALRIRSAPRPRPIPGAPRPTPRPRSAFALGTTFAPRPLPSLAQYLRPHARASRAGALAPPSALVRPTPPTRRSPSRPPAVRPTSRPRSASRPTPLPRLRNAKSPAVRCRRARPRSVTTSIPARSARTSISSDASDASRRVGRHRRGWPPARYPLSPRRPRRLQGRPAALRSTGQSFRAPPSRWHWRSADCP
jgi:hypothetical protein